MGVFSKSGFWWNRGYSKEVKDKILNNIEKYTMTEMLPEAKSQCMVKDGHLRDSGNVIRENDNILIGFGKGPSQKYAVMQHERMDLHHNVGKAKFLQDPFNQMAKEIIDKSSREGLK